MSAVSGTSSKTERLPPDARGLKALARAVERRRRADAGSPSFRVWLPAESAVEDAYAAAFALFECLEKARDLGRLRVFATAPDAAAVGEARRGFFGPAARRRFPSGLLRRGFKREGGGRRVLPWLRRLCVFAVHDFAEALPFVQLDAVVCRLPLARWPPAARQRALDLFHFALKPGGLLLLPGGAAIPPGDGRFERLPGSPRLYGRPLAETGPKAEVHRLLGQAAQALFDRWRGRDRRDASGESRLRRDDFIAMTTHELMTPLTSILGCAEALRAGASGAERVAMLGMIERNARRLIATSEALIGVVDARARARKASSIDLARALRVAARMFKERARKAGVAVRLEAAHGLRVFADPADLPHILENLIGNAVKYNRRGGRVDVRAAREGRHVVISIADTGVGIPADSIDRVFDRFYRCPSARRLKGSGLGLSIARDLSIANDGRVEVESRDGAGSTFRVVLPAPPEKI